jgi:hypothetical protein
MTKVKFPDDPDHCIIHRFRLFFTLKIIVYLILKDGDAYYKYPFNEGLFKQGQPFPYRLSLCKGRQSGNAVAEKNMVDTHHGGFTISHSHESYDI